MGDTMDTSIFTPILIGTIIATICTTIIKFLLEILIKSFNPSFEAKRKQKEIVVQMRLKYLDKIFLTIEQAYSLAILNHDIKQVEKILFRISKYYIPLNLYFADKEINLLNKIIDEIKKSTEQDASTSNNYINLLNEFKKCLDVN